MLEGVEGWKRIAPTSPDGVANVLGLLAAAKAKGSAVTVYLGTDDQVHSVVMQ
jgi:hypothetical protein